MSDEKQLNGKTKMIIIFGNQTENYIWLHYKYAFQFRKKLTRRIHLSVWRSKVFS